MAKKTRQANSRIAIYQRFFFTFSLTKTHTETIKTEKLIGIQICVKTSLQSSGAEIFTYKSGIFTLSILTGLINEFMEEDMRLTNCPKPYDANNQYPNTIKYDATMSGRNVVFQVFWERHEDI